MISIAYVSSAVGAFNETKLLDLVAQCQRNNEKLGVTGILVYSDGNFMQVTEGDAARTFVRALAAPQSGPSIR